MLIAIIGKSNVGKSTLFNRLSSFKKNIVSDRSGVTRDKIVVPAQLGSLFFDICDTPGFENFVLKKNKSINSNLYSSQAIQECDIIFFIIDGQKLLTSEDFLIASLIKENNKKCYLLVNKSENSKKLHYGNEYIRLGFKDIIYISAKNGDGMIDLCTKMNEDYPNLFNFKKKIKPDLRVLISGRPNVGKSTLVNSLIGENRIFVDNQSGSTRDPININWNYKGKLIEIVDSAGLRRISLIKDKVEKEAAINAIERSKYCHAVILVIDAQEDISKQDLRIVNNAINEGRILIVVFNKWDLISHQDQKKIKDHFEFELDNYISQISNIPIIYISAKEKYNIYSIIDEIINIYPKWSQNFSTSKLNKWLSSAVFNHDVPSVYKNKKLKFKYCTQVKTSPPSIKIFCNYPDKIQDSYKSYLRNYFREFFNLHKVPLRFYFVKTDNPYID